MTQNLTINGKPLTGIAVMFDTGEVQMSKAGKRRSATPYRRGTVVSVANEKDAKLIGKRVNLWGDTFEGIEGLDGRLVDMQFTLRDKIKTGDSNQETYIIANAKVLGIANEEEVASATDAVRHAQLDNLETRGARSVTPTLNAITPGDVAPENTLLAASGDLAPEAAGAPQEEAFA